MDTRPDSASDVTGRDRSGPGSDPHGAGGAGAGRRPLLVCLSHLRWDFVWQRPQHLLTRAARDHDVVFFEEPGTGDVDEPALHIATREGGVRVALPLLPAGCDDPVAAQRRLLDAFLAEDGRRPAVLWFYTPMAMSFAGHVGADLVVYDNMDELSAFRGASPELLAREEALLARADIVFTGGHSLFEAKKDRHPNVHAFPSSIEAAHFEAARRRPADDPPDQAGIARPRIGFFGVIDERMDLDLVAALAAARPHWQLVLIGPVVKIDPATLPNAANIHWLGPKTYDELPAYLAGWDLGFMPFALNEATRFISPTKTPEFLAAGLPVLSTAIRDVQRSYGEAGLVAIAADAAEMARLGDEWLRGPPEGWLAAVDRQLRSGSWDATWAGMRAALAASARARDAAGAAG